MTKGIYVLIISVSKNINVNIGTLGKILFGKGLYAYVGSAQNNLEKRIERHLRRDKRRFWHIDYLLNNDYVKVCRIFYAKAEKAEECRIAVKLGRIGVPIKDFGSSDCNCASHLFRLRDYEFLKESMHELTMHSRERAVVAEDGWCVWVTGLPGSGKSVVAEALLKLLNQKSVHAQLLASDALRKVLTPEPTYSLEERDIVYATLVYIAKLLTQNGVNVVIDATGNLRRYRETAREGIQKFMEVYLECPLDVCMEREAKRKITHQAPKRIYAGAKEGNAPTVPGVGQPYELPINPELAIDTSKCTPVESAHRIFEFLIECFHRKL